MLCPWAEQGADVTFPAAQPSPEQQPHHHYLLVSSQLSSIPSPLICSTWAHSYSCLRGPKPAWIPPALPPYEMANFKLLLLLLQAAPRLVVPYPQAAHVLPAADSHSMPHLQAQLWNDDWDGNDYSSATTSSSERVHSQPASMPCPDELQRYSTGCKNRWPWSRTNKYSSWMFIFKKRNHTKRLIKKRQQNVLVLQYPMVWLLFSVTAMWLSSAYLWEVTVVFVALNLLWDGKKHKAVRASSSPANCACRLVAICCPQSNKNLSQKPLTRCSLPHRAFLTPHLSLFHRMCHSWHIAPPCFSWTFKL